MNPIKSISIVGTGNVAFHIGRALINSGYILEEIYGRDLKKAHELADLLNCSVAEKLSILKGELVILCVNDGVIQAIGEQIPSDKMIVHTSGAISMDALKGHKRSGVLYPLQTLSKTRGLEFKEVPLLIEANEQDFTNLLVELANKLSLKVVSVNSDERKIIHLAAVFVNNFVNHLVLQSRSIMESKNLDWNLLVPLLDETIHKIKEIGPLEAQTGPARRNDSKTINEHMNLLSGKEKEIYQLISDSIRQTYNS
jgi:predicted short-subunit dehydrogenase-like oxidoreductase (DUF2520 family)